MGNEEDLVVGQRVIDHFRFLYRLMITKKAEKRIELVRNATKDQILALVEIASNIIGRRFRLSKVSRRKLERHWEFMERLSRTRTPRGAMRVIQEGEGTQWGGGGDLPVQTGGILPAMLIPVLVGLAANMGKELYHAIKNSD